MIRSLKALFRVDGSDVEGDPGFDVDFYRANNPDLARLKGDRRLLEHYRRYGRDEGRFPTMDKAREHFQARNRALPPDFDMNAYRALNPDLQKACSTDWQYELHYLNYGFSEGRRYKSDFETGKSPWHSIFNLYDFLLFSRSWRSDTNPTLAEAIRLFEDEGVKRLTPLAKDFVFDPNFYRHQFAVNRERADDLYRDWLERGFSLGRAPNEQQAVFQYLGGRPYPSCFDWRGLTSSDATTAVYPGRIVALQKLFESPLKTVRRHVRGPGAAELFMALGDFNLIRGLHADALQAYDMSFAAGGHTALLHLHRGDAHRHLGHTAEAIADYRQAMTFGAYSVWAVYHAAVLTQSQQAMPVQLSFQNWDAFQTSKRGHPDNGPEAYVAVLDTAFERWAGDPVYRNVVDECIETQFRTTSKTMATAIRAGEVALANDIADRELPKLVALIARLKIGGPRVINRTGHRVAMLACLDLRQCTHYRVQQKEEQLALHGIELDVTDFNDPSSFMQTLPGCSAAIFYRVPAYPKIIEAILYARALGIPTYYDIDDLIFTTDFPDTFASYENQISFDDYLGLVHGVGLYRNAIALCDYGLASTRPLADRLGSLVSTKVAHVVPNALDSRNEGAIRTGALARFPRDAVTIFYGSGTKAHNQDFTELVAPALLALFETHPTLRLLLVGHLALDQRFAAFADRIDRFPIIDNLEQYWALLSAADINIAVLSASVVTDCKSEIKWLEAAILGVPSVVSPTETFRQVLDTPMDGLFAAQPSEWLAALSSLIEDPALRLSIGQAARAKALRSYALAPTSRLLVEALKLGPMLAAERPAHKRARPKILLCNVFFSPQTHGGATRVMENNIDYILEHHGDEYELAVVATDQGMPSGRFRIDNYRGCPVFRIATPVERNMDWRPFNHDNIKHFENILDMFEPDLVHFHCIQRLTASIVECTLKRDIPYVVTLHDGWWISDHQFLIDQHDVLVDVADTGLSSTLPVDVTRLASLERRKRLRGLLQQAYATLAVSKPFAAIHRSAGITNTRVIENGLSPLPPPLPAATPEDKLVLGHIGGRRVHKGATLIEIALKQHSLENLELVMIDGSIAYGEEISLRWGETVVSLRGAYPQRDTAQLFASFDVLLAPSIWPESYGLVTREADFYGKWTVASNRGAIGTDIEEGSSGFKIDVSDTNDLVRILTAMNADPTAYKSRIPRTSPLRTADDQGRELIALYQEIFARPLSFAVSENRATARRRTDLHASPGKAMSTNF